MKKKLNWACALMATFWSVVASVAVADETSATQSVYTTYCWMKGEAKVTSDFLTSNASRDRQKGPIGGIVVTADDPVTFSVVSSVIPVGCHVAYWKWGYFSDGWDMRKTVATHETTYTWNVGEHTGASDGKYLLGVAIDYFPYTLAYAAGEGGSGSMTALSGLYYTNKVTLANCAFKRDGYSFMGWRSSLNDKLFAAGETVTGADLGITYADTLTLTAEWTASTLTVTYDAQGGSVAPASTAATYGKHYGELPTPTRTGYDFAGWYTTRNGGTQVTDETSVTVATDHTLYAHWTASTYCVYFAAGTGATGTMTNQTFTWGVVQPLARCTFTCPDYRFVGWATHAGGPVVYADEQMVSNLTTEASMQLTAVWRRQNYTVWYSANGGEGVMSNEVFTCDVSRPLAPCRYTHGDLVFRGWATADSSGRVVYKDEQMVKNLTEESVVQLIAVWGVPQPYVVHFDGNGATGGSMPNQMFLGGEAQALLKNVYTRTGCAFVGWATPDSSGAVVYRDEQEVKGITSEDSVTLTAVWSSSAYTVRFESGSDETTGSMPEQTIACTVPTALASNCYVRTGYVFAGWRNRTTNDSYADRETVTDLAGLNGSVTLTAEWRKAQYRVAYFGNGGTNTMEAQEFTCGEGQSLTSNVFGRVGYTFRGWALDPEDAKVKYADGVRVNNLTTTDGATVRLYALWQKDVQTLTEWQQALNCTTADVWPTNIAKSGTVNIAPGTISPIGSGVRLGVTANDGYISHSTLAFDVTGPGTFSFEYYTQICDVNVDETKQSKLRVGKTSGLKSDPTEFYWETNVTTSAWTKQSVHVAGTDGPICIDLYRPKGDFATTNDYAEIRNVTWTPAGVVAPSATVGMTYRLNDGTAAPGDIYTNTTEVAGASYHASWPSEPVRAGYAFSGWLPKAGGSAVTAEDPVPTTDTVYVAQWTMTPYQIEYKDLKGAVNPKANPSTYTVTQEVIFAALPNVKGYTFQGWTPAALQKGTTGNQTVTAVWEALCYSFVEDGVATNCVYGSTVECRTTASVLNGRTNVVCTGWVGTGDVPAVGTTNRVVFTVTQSSTLTWQYVTNYWVEVTADAGGTVLGMTNASWCAAGSALTMTAVADVGYRFVGWMDGTGATHTTDATLALAVDGPQIWQARFAVITPDEPVGPDDPVVPVEPDDPVVPDEPDDPVIPDDPDDPIIPEVAAFDAAGAYTYDGYLTDGDGLLAGQITVKTTKATRSKGVMMTTVTATLQLAGETKKVTLKGKAAVSNATFTATAKDGRHLALALTRDTLSGTFGDCAITGMRNLLSSTLKTDKGTEAKVAAEAVLARCRGVYAVACPSTAGYGALSVTLKAKGKVSVTGKLPGGVSLSATSQLIVGDATSVVPIVWTKKNQSLALALIFTNTTADVTVTGYEDATVGAVGALGAGCAFDVDATTLNALFASGGYTLDADALPSGVSVTVNGKKWVIDSAGQTAKLKLTPNAKTGLFTGSFKVYTVGANGRSKTFTASVTGTVVHGVGYGAATVKRIGSVLAILAP